MSPWCIFTYIMGVDFSIHRKCCFVSDYKICEKILVLTVLDESFRSRGKSFVDNARLTCIRYGCHRRSSLVILLKPEDEIPTGLRRALTSRGFCWSRALTAAIFSADRVVLRLPELPLSSCIQIFPDVAQNCTFDRRIPTRKPCSKSVLHCGYTLSLSIM